MPTIKHITLPDGVTYDFTATAQNKEFVKIVTDYTLSGQFNALEVTEDENQRWLYNINNPFGSALMTYQPALSAVDREFVVNYKLHAKDGISFVDDTSLPAATASPGYNVLCVNVDRDINYCTATYNNVANSIVTRNASGDITGHDFFGRYYNTSVDAVNISSYTSSVAFIDSNGYLRKTSKANFNTWVKDNSGSQTLNATYGAYYQRVNGICTVRVDYRSNVTSTITVGTLPTGYRPPWQVMATNATGGTNSAYLLIGTNGSVQLAKIGNGGWCIATITYPV